MPNSSQSRRRLPPMKSLVAFEAVGRLLSFSGAAEDLCVTPGAVSRHVSALEEHFGTPLFIRNHRNITLTEQGSLLLKEATRAFNILESASREINEQSTVRPLSIACPITFASRWLVPRLKHFRKKHPDLLFKLSIIENTLAAVESNEIELAICVGTGPWPGLHAHRLFTSKLSAFCAPGYLPHNTPQNPEELLNFPMIYSTARKKNWKEWFEHANVSGFSPSKVIELPTSVLALQAAADGMGIALADINLVRRELRDGVLVPATDFSVDMGYGYWMVTKEDVAHPEADLFRDWVLEDLAQTELNLRPMSSG